MKNFRLTELGALSKGERFRKEDMSPGTIPYIGAIDSNNGVAAHCEKVEGMNIHPAGSITIPYNGSIGYAFVQPKEFYAGDDVNILTPFTDNILSKLYICAALRMEKFRFNYGRKWNLDRMKLSKIKLPERNGEPDYDKMAEIVGTAIPDYSHLKNAKSEEEVELKDWKNFDIHELFKISRQQGPSVEWVEENPGEIPFVSATKFNNGISGHCIETKEYQKVKGGCLTIQANGTDIGTCFLQKEDFYITGDVVTATPRVQISNEGLIYCATLISNNIYKFNYGRKFNGVRTHIKISLPTKNGLPDWDGIRQYMNSCKFSATI